MIFKQEKHSNIIWTLAIHKQTSLNFDDKKYYAGPDAQCHARDFCQAIHNRMCDDTRGGKLGACQLGFLTMEIHYTFTFNLKTQKYFHRYAFRPRVTR